jgi:K+-transporting ATPase ATPase A chain
VTLAGWAQYAIFAAALTALTPPLGGYLARVFAHDPVVLDRVLGPVERVVYRLLGVDPRAGQAWRRYATSMLTFSAVSLAAAYVAIRPRLPWDVAFNTAVSFTSNTSWQFYAGEVSLTALTQLLAIDAPSWLGAGVGLAVGIAVVRGVTGRGVTRHRAEPAVGNFWADLVRGLLYVLLPLGVVGALVLAAAGVVQSWDAGLVASHDVIKTMGSVGGGWFNVNSAMPYENAGAVSNVVQALLIVLLPAALTSTFGRYAGNRRQGWMLYLVMLGLLTAGFAATYAAEAGPTPAMASAGVDGANLEGKEQRFGAAGTALFAVVTTAGASGAVNGAMESLSGAGALVPTANMLTGEVVFGGVGSGMTSMLLVVMLAVFLAGLMVGRTPEYLGRQLGPREIRLAVLGTIAAPLVVAACAAVAIATEAGRASIFATGPHGLAETVYAYASQGFNNGSAMAGYTGFVAPDASMTFANVLGGVAMLLGRYVPLVLALALAGALAARPRRPLGPGTLRTDSVDFGTLVVGVIVVVALLTFAPLLALGLGAEAMTPTLF